jgi:hypothetical protein
VSPTPIDEPARRRRSRPVDPGGQGTWLDLGSGDGAPAGNAVGHVPDGAPAAGIPLEEPDWLREVPLEPDLAASPALAPADLEAAIAARRAARAEEIVSRLNPEQARAVTTIDGPLLILAGAGSGKTRVLTHRVAHLLDQGAPGGSILAVTLDRKSVV